MMKSTYYNALVTEQIGRKWIKNSLFNNIIQISKRMIDVTIIFVNEINFLVVGV